MAIELQPEIEQLVQEEIRNGHFDSLDDMVAMAVEARRQRAVPVTPLAHRQPLSQFFRQSPLVGLELDFERESDPGRDIAR